MMKKNELVELSTPFEGGGEHTWSEYPRPQMKRESYYPLDGEWELSLMGGGGILPVSRIKLPFVPESRLSGVGSTLEKGQKWLYTKSFRIPEGFNVGRVLLHFGAVDQIAEVSLNGHIFEAHVGGYNSFEYDITEQLTDGENNLCVTVTDELDTDIPYGKQRKKRGGMWYTPISGIWQTVWLESVPENYIKSLRITPTLTSVTVEVEGGAEDKTLTLGDAVISFTGNKVTVDINEPRLWYPEDPYLYYFELKSGKDNVSSYFGLRTVSIENFSGHPYICLNGKPYFFNGLLDQGYYSDGIYLPASPDGYIFDILKMKELGFNTLRKHIKVEPELFYYYCDKYGMVVFQDMVNSGGYSFLVDTALPTLGFKRFVTHHASKRRRELFLAGCFDTVAQLYNHPSVCYYTVFNEGWGQFDADSLFGMLKSSDPTRIWDTTSGWFKKRASDVESEHVYFKKLDLKSSSCPLVLSEFGGYSFQVEGHMANPHKTYGYKSMSSFDELEKSLASLYLNEVIPMIERGLSAAVLTQVSDVEDEINGLVTYDRQVVKVSADVMRGISDAVMKKFHDVVSKD